MEIFNNPAFIILEIVLTVAAVVGLLYMLLPALVRKGVNIPGILDKADLTVDTLKTISASLKNLFPGSQALDIASMIFSFADKAVDGAEQMYLASLIPAEKRKEEARKMIYESLNAVGVEMTETLETVVDGAIEAAVYALPKTSRQKQIKIGFASDSQGEKNE